MTGKQANNKAKTKYYSTKFLKSEGNSI